MKKMAEVEVPILKMHYPTPEDLAKSAAFQSTTENYALIIGLSDYDGVVDDERKEIKDIPHAVHDACAIRQFLLKSKV